VLAEGGWASHLSSTNWSVASGVAFDGEERHPQAVDADVGELLLLPLRGLPYAFQRL
jgi:hypothetical protein